tara:strand:- start:8088 stop:12485 length:4398 start_codon:yes stop_codon:yes gene_type:complete
MFGFYPLKAYIYNAKTLIMKKTLNLVGLSILLTLNLFTSVSQDVKKVDFNASETTKAAADLAGTPQIRASNAGYFSMDIAQLQNGLVGVKHREIDNIGFVAQISLPHPDGSFHTYNVKENSTMHPTLGAMFPEIKTYDAHGIDDASFVKLDITPHGFHAMIMRPGKSTIYIDPVIKGNTNLYIAYEKNSLITNKVKNCSFTNVLEDLDNAKILTSGIVKNYGTCELRTYRLALSATGEYTNFHGGTVAQSLSAQVVTMNRVNGVFEQDMAVTMVIIPNNNLIIYTNTATDPFSNGQAGTMLGENQSNTDAVIGSANYDIGHVFGTNSGGVAGLGVVCSNGNKARGVTGSGAPIGDAFDIDYVAHEIGHQFGGNHTFNNFCGGARANAVAFEPGSGSTIMAYAGICAPNVQNNSDDHFHGASLQEFSFEIASAGHTCEAITSLSNSAPIISSVNGGITVPANTPFSLTATATDADGDIMTYNWEQMDNDISTQAPLATSTSGPNFRSNPSELSPTRYFPNLATLASGAASTWEVLPSVTRTMNFRVTVRDNSSGAGGCFDHENTTITTDASSGPFVVTYPSATGIVWGGNTSETITWDVANTTSAPVSAATVDIFLSTDGGATYPTQIANDVANDGSEVITVPNVATTTARIMVMNSAGTFFDISDNNFEITLATFDYTMTTTPSVVSICQPNDATYNIAIGQIGGYTDPVNLSVTGVPAGATATFTPSAVNPVGSSVLVISNTGAATQGVYTLTITGNSTSGIKTNTVTLSLAGGTPSPVSQVSPTNGAIGVSTPTNFTWTTAPEVGVTYEIDIASDAGFAALIDQATGLATATYTSTVLGPNTTYYWRVRSVTGCGTSAWSSTFNFSTDGCFSTDATDVPITISASGTPTITSTINIAGAGIITDVNVLNLIGTHTWINDMIVTLTSPAGTVVSLWSQVCNNEDNFDLNFDDAAAAGALPCPPIGGGTYQPAGSLASLNGESITGNWILTVSDAVNQDGGELQSWTLELCTNPIVCNDPTTPTLSNDVAICDGSSTTLSVASGSLNDATAWQWYTGSCGGTAEGNGTSISVSPTTTTTYFARGEGGCVTPGICSSVTVTVNSPDNTTQSASICNGQTYTFPDGSTGTNAQTQTSVLTNTNSCDSIIVTTLTVNAADNTTQTASICNGQTYTFPDGSTGTTGQTQTSTLTNGNGCDSIIVTTLTVVTTFNTTQSASICNGQTYTFPDGSTGTTGQTQTSTLMSSGGCDSIIVTTLTVNPVDNTTQTGSICQGQTYTFPDGSTGTTSQTQTSVLTNGNGCDSIIVTTLTVQTVDVSVTDGGGILTANFNGGTYQWLDCNNGNNPIAGATNQSFTPTATVGNYSVIVTDGPCSDTSACTLVDFTGIEENDINQVVIYPNPATTNITIEWIGEIDYIEVTDTKGKVLNRIEKFDGQSYQLSVTNFAKGVYFIHIGNEFGRTVYDIVKQ